MQEKSLVTKPLGISLRRPRHRYENIMDYLKGQRVSRRVVSYPVKTFSAFYKIYIVVTEHTKATYQSTLSYLVSQGTSMRHNFLFLQPHRYSVIITTRLLDRRRLDIFLFFKSSTALLGPLSGHQDRGVELTTDLHLVSNVEVQNAWSYTSIPHMLPHGAVFTVYRDSFALIFTMG